MEEKYSNIDKRITAAYLRSLLIEESISTSDEKCFNKDKAYQRFLTRTGKTIEIVQRKNQWRILWQSAASVAILALIAYISFQQGSQQVKERFTNITIEAPWGSRTKTYLPDGTLVWLNAGSNLTYSQGFGVNERAVYLNGEGYFEVMRNEKLPFYVKTEELQVEVLGTKFNFQNFPEDIEATVSLLEGKILVSNSIKRDENKILSPDQKIFFDKKEGTMRLIQVDAQNTIEWTNGYLFFDEELLCDIVKELERSYDVKIILQDTALKNLRFYGNFVRKELSIEDVLDMLATTGQVKYHREGKEITLSSSQK